MASAQPSTAAPAPRPLPPLSPAPTPTSIVKRLFLCRHGETEPNARGVLQGSGLDEFLNKTGVRQAQYLRDRLEHTHVDLFVSSKLKIVQERHAGKPLIEVEELAEISWGEWEGRVVPGLRSLLDQWIAGDFNAKTPGGESPLEVEARSVPALYDIILSRPEQTMVIVVHGRLLRIMLASMLFQSLDRMNEFTHHNTCINMIDVIIETDPSRVGPAIRVDRDLLEAQLRSPLHTRELDDNVSIVTETPVVPSPPGLPGTVASPAWPEGRKPHVSTVQHPPSLTLIPLLLDDRSHLPINMR
ncbi:hypothetical protein HK105_208767 [Polyrhizophydium stewartii]|uniref:Phosphoglycerate mutase n=1 Tax=Polyrhizophydium stewartii TaxID=2732419 RepID=A0ABR4MX18_9FUNG